MMPPASETASTSSWSTQSAPALRRLGSSTRWPYGNCEDGKGRDQPAKVTSSGVVAVGSAYRPWVLG
jgi:hypothetical protein